MIPERSTDTVHGDGVDSEDTPESRPQRQRAGLGGLGSLELEPEHRSLGAKMSPFAGWNMPLSYDSIVAEHMAVRTGAGLFDVSHMGRLLVRGRDALRAASGVVAGDLSRLEMGQVKYTVLLTDEGGVRDDLMIVRVPDGALLIVNASHVSSKREWIEAHLPDTCAIEDLTGATCLLALQGPQAREALSSLAGPAALPPPFRSVKAMVAGVEALVMGTGYTGEDGVEIMIPSDRAKAVWRALLQAGSPVAVKPCGLGARDTLRLEAAMLLYGQDVDENVSPFEAGIGRVVDLVRAGGEDFVGREALCRAQPQGPRRLLVGVTTGERSIPRSGDDILVEGAPVGRITSGSFSPILRQPIALGYVTPALAETGREVHVASKRRVISARITALPFYRRARGRARGEA